MATKFAHGNVTLQTGPWYDAAGGSTTTAYPVVGDVANLNGHTVTLDGGSLAQGITWTNTAVTSGHIDGTSADGLSVDGGSLSFDSSGGTLLLDGGSLSISLNGSLAVSSGSLSLRGFSTLDISNTGYLNLVNGNLVSYSSGNITVSGGTLTIDGACFLAVESYSTLYVFDSTFTMNHGSSLHIYNYGFITVDVGATLILDHGSILYVNDDAALTVAVYSTLTIDSAVRVTVNNYRTLYAYDGYITDSSASSPTATIFLPDTTLDPQLNASIIGLALHTSPLAEITNVLVKAYLNGVVASTGTGYAKVSGTSYDYVIIADYFNVSPKAGDSLDLYVEVTTAGGTVGKWYHTGYHPTVTDSAAVQAACTAACTVALDASIGTDPAIVLSDSVAGIIKTNLNDTITSRMASFTYIAPDNSGISSAASSAETAASNTSGLGAFMTKCLRWLRFLGRSDSPAAGSTDDFNAKDGDYTAAQAGTFNPTTMSEQAIADAAAAASNASNFTGSFPESVLIHTPTGPLGPGGTAFTVTVRDTSNNLLSGVLVWVTSDLAGMTTIAGTLITNALGQVTFMLPSGPAYVWRMSPVYSFPNPQAISVS